MPVIARVGCCAAGKRPITLGTDAVRVTVSVTFAPGLAITLIGVVKLAWPAETVTDAAIVTIVPAPGPVKTRVTMTAATGG